MSKLSPKFGKNENITVISSYQNHMKISLDQIYDSFNHGLDTTSKFPERVFDALPFKLVNAAVILAFSSSLEFQIVLMVFLSTAPHT